MSNKKPGQLSNAAAGRLGTVLLVFGVAGILAGTSRIEDPVFATGNIMSAGLLWTSCWIFTVVKLSKEKEGDSAREDE